MRDKGMAVVAGEVKSEVDRPAAPGKKKKDFRRGSYQPFMPFEWHAQIDRLRSSMYVPLVHACKYPEIVSATKGAVRGGPQNAVS